MDAGYQPVKVGEPSFRWFVLDVNPEPWAIGPVGVSRVGGKLRPYVGRNAQLDAYKQAIADELGDQEMLTGKIILRFFFWRNRAEYETPQARTHRKHEADTTNLQKSTEDALQGILFKNDKDVPDIHSRLVEQGPDVKGRVVIGIKSTSRDYIDIELPQVVWDLMEKMDGETHEYNPSSNEWRGPDASLF